VRQSPSYPPHRSQLARTTSTSGTIIASAGNVSNLGGVNTPNMGMGMNGQTPGNFSNGAGPLEGINFRQLLEKDVDADYDVRFSPAFFYLY
jgi:hypothetical protein